ncbi:sel1 repeat family protein [Catenovulum sp. SM1970]|uniref:tetratricopeptide repeat protein n=1 Tax=Marinifaba aquimaris TaxID=2741323 RepID=UPI0015722C77|nr:tetratricopeptide repeat protein [Marinifaba aquimaris]NTS76881.1 sel1 repeat family protein [Marinifaba aquimaris]
MKQHSFCPLKLCLLCVAVVLFFYVSKASAELKVVQIYKQDELISWINKNQHLARVVEDNCQLIQDIEARAKVVKNPAYQFLWGDMLAWGVCVDKNPTLGLYYIQESANQGLPAALEQLGRYYHQGTLVQIDIKRSLIYLREAAAMGNLNAQLRLVEMYCDDLGSPRDYEDAYHWLHNAVIADKFQHKRAKNLLANLAERMPEKVLKRAMRPLEY